MGDLLQRGMDWLQAQRHQHLSRPVTYRRGQATVVLLASVGRTNFELDDGAGAVVREESRDYLIRSMDLVLEGQRTLPQRGDRVEEADALTGNTIIYEVFGYGDQPPYRYSDPNRRTLRIHTKQTDRA